MSCLLVIACMSLQDYSPQRRLEKEDNECVNLVGEECDLMVIVASSAFAWWLC